MTLARVVTFDGVSSSRMDEIREQVREDDREEIPASEVMMLHDPEAEKAVVVLFFESQEDYDRADQTLSAMSADETPGQRTSVGKYDVAVRMTV